MLGIGGKDKHKVDPTKLPLLVHVLQSNEAFALAEKVWQTNQRYQRIDQANRKELQRFVFANPACVAWLQRDMGRSDCFELVLLWDNTDSEDVTEVYALCKAAGPQVGDDIRAKSLLGAMLAAPATVPASGR